MNLTNKISFWAFPHLLILLVVLITYNGLTETFYQQDEWWVFGNVILSSNDGLLHFLKNTLYEAGKVHAIPISASIPFIEYKLFGFNFEAYAAVSIINHLIVSILVYILALTLFKNRFLALLSGLLFAVYGISHQAITWVAAVNTQVVVIFSLSCIIFFLKYVQKANGNRYLFLSLLFLFLALFSNESAFSLFLILPLIWLIYKGLSSKKSFFRLLVKLFLLSTLYLVIRLPIWLNAKTIILDQNQVLTQPDIGVFFYRLAMLPFRVLPQTFIPQQPLLDLSELILKPGYPNLYFSSVSGQIKETLVFDLVCIFLFTLLTSFFFISFEFFKKQKKDNFSKSLVVAFLILVLSGIMLIFIPGKAGYVSIFEKKHLYMSSSAAAILIVLGLYVIASFLVRNNYFRNFLILTFFIPFFLFNIFKVQTDIEELKKIGSLRKSFLTTIYHDYPDLPKSVVFYLQSDTSYYGMPPEEKNLPIQTGFGRMLLVWYQSSEEFPPCLYEGLFLQHMTSQGYKECEDRGFGYFRDYDKLVAQIKEAKLPAENVIAYSWNGGSFEFKDISGDIRKKVLDEANKDEN